MRHTILLVLLQVLSSCHSHPIFATENTACKVSGILYSDPLLGLENGADTWQGHGKLYCANVDGVISDQRVQLCLSSWLGFESVSDFSPELELASEVLEVPDSRTLLQSMEVQIQDDLPVTNLGYKMVGWPFVKNYTMYLGGIDSTLVVKQLRIATLTIAPTNDISLKASCGIF